jgi:hypothetical protein
LGKEGIFALIMNHPTDQVGSPITDQWINPAFFFGAVDYVHGGAAVQG